MKPVHVLNFSSCCVTTTGGLDFSATEFLLTLSDIRPSGTFTISILNDNMFELTESFRVNLYFPGGLVPRVTLKPSTATVTIYDDDCKLS